MKDNTIPLPKTLKSKVLNMSNKEYKNFETNLELYSGKLNNKQTLLKHKSPSQRPPLPGVYRPYKVNPRLLRALNYNTTSENTKQITMNKLKQKINNVNEQQLRKEINNIKNKLNSFYK